LEVILEGMNFGRRGIGSAKGIHIDSIINSNPRISRYKRHSKNAALNNIERRMYILPSMIYFVK
jgi:5-methylthioribose kinase